MDKKTKLFQFLSDRINSKKSLWVKTQSFTEKIKGMNCKVDLYVYTIGEFLVYMRDPVGSQDPTTSGLWAFGTSKSWGTPCETEPRTPRVKPDINPLSSKNGQLEGKRGGNYRGEGQKRLCFSIPKLQWSFMICVYCEIEHSSHIWH